jgi:hypothetical protein
LERLIVGLVSEVKRGRAEDLAFQVCFDKLIARLPSESTQCTRERMGVQQY